VNQLDEEADESHDEKSDAGRASDGGELLPIGLGTLFDEVDGILGELLEGLDEHLVESFLLSHDCEIICFYRCRLRRALFSGVRATRSGIEWKMRTARLESSARAKIDERNYRSPCSRLSGDEE